MRICITRTEKNAYSETFIRNQIKGLSDLADVYTIYGGRLPDKKENDEIIGSKLLWILHKIFKVFVGRNNVFSHYGLKKYLRDHKIDLVVGNYGMSASHMMPICKALNIPLIAVFHGHDATDKKLIRQYKKRYKKLFEYASSVIAVSQVMKMKLIEMGADENILRVIPYGVDLEKFKPNRVPYKNELNFLAVGRFTPKKAPLTTIKAFHSVLQNFPEATLTMVGKKDGLYEDCANLVSELNIEGSVIFPGVLNQEEIVALMNQSLAFVQHSITAPNGDMEGTPNSILEASATGLPVISTLHGGIMDAIVHGKTGFLVEELDLEGMANYMTQLCENPHLAREFGDEGRKHMEKHHVQHVQIKKIYDLAVEAVKK